MSFICVACTYENGALDEVCLMCETPKPTPAAARPVQSSSVAAAPPASSAPVVKVSAVAAAAPDWFQWWDEGQRTYYYHNSKTQESIWEKPPGGAPFVPHAGPVPVKLRCTLRALFRARGFCRKGVFLTSVLHVVKGCGKAA